MIDQDLFELSAEPDIRFEKLGNLVPVILVDNVYRRPDDIREMALALDYATPPYPYPGKLALIPEPNRSLVDLRRKVLGLVNGQYLARVPVAQNGQRITSFRQLYTDFGIVDVHPGDLNAAQRIPHTDPVPVFGLVYLNREERGGTLFFKQTRQVDTEAQEPGYITASNEAFELIARIEPAYNRMAIYPGFVPHAGEISGDWIQGEDRFKSPRLTQRLVFFP